MTNVDNGAGAARMELIKKKKRNRRRQEEPLAPRFKRKALRALKVLVALAILPALGYGGFRLYRVLITTQYLAIKTIKVTGAEMVRAEDAIGLSGITEGQNLFSFKAGDAIEGLKTNPWVKEAEINRNLPGTVVIEITERRPLALVRLDGLYVMDSSGAVFKKYSVEDRLDLPVVTGLTKEALEGEGGAGHDSEGLLELIAVLKSREGFNMAKVSEINVDETFGLSIYTLDEGVRLAVGNGGFREKLDSFEKVVAARGGLVRGIEAMDLNNAGSIVVRFTTKAFKEGGVSYGQKG